MIVYKIYLITLQSSHLNIQLEWYIYVCLAVNNVVTAKLNGSIVCTEMVNISDKKHGPSRYSIPFQYGVPYSNVTTQFAGHFKSYNPLFKDNGKSDNNSGK